MWTGFDIKGVAIILSQKWTFMAITGIQVLSEPVDVLGESFRVLNTITCLNTPSTVFSVLHPILIFLRIVTTSPGPGNTVLDTVEPETFYMDVICDIVLGGLEAGESQDDVYMRYICCKFWCDLKLTSALQRRSHCMSRWEGMMGNVSYSTSLERSFARTFLCVRLPTTAFPGRPVDYRQSTSVILSTIYCRLLSLTSQSDTCGDGIMLS